MILRSPNRAGVHESRRPAVPGQLSPSRYRGDDPTERIRMLTEALRGYGYNIPQTLLAGPEAVCWIG